jgi:Tol biopolymer transport system component
MMPTVILLLLLAFLLMPRAHAQVDLPLAAPLLAFDTAAQDRVVLYDVTHDRWRELRLGDGRVTADGTPLPFGALHRVWGFSPDGCRLLVTLHDGSTPGDLVTLRLDGRDLHAPIRYDSLPPGAWGIWEAQWSPDGSRIAATFIRQQIAEGGTLIQEHRIGWIDGARAAADHAAEVALISVSGDEHHPRWSPDGRWLAYISFEERIPGADIYSTAVPTPNGAPSGALPNATLREADIWIVSSDGATKYRLTDFPIGSVSLPRWSPDGDLIAFAFSPAPNQDLLWMIGAQRGAVPTQLTYNIAQALDLHWLPDGSSLIAPIRSFNDDDANRLWQVPLVGGADAGSSLYVGADAHPYANFPRFSADGRYLVFRSAYALILLDTQTGAQRTLAAPDGAWLGNTAPVWSPAGFAGESACA